jgi:outer membrane protein
LLPKLNFAGAIGLNGLSGTDSHATFDLGGAPIPVQTNPSLVGDYGHALELLHDGRYYNYSAGVSVEIPIDNAQAKAGYAQANIGLDQSRLALQKLEEGVTLEIKTAVSNLQSDLKSIDATRIARELAEENVRNQQGRYDVGLATTKDMLDFQNLLIRARFAEIQALTAYNSALAELRRADGTLLSARNVLIERVDAEKARWWASF